MGYFFRPYVPVAQKEKIARKRVATLSNRGIDVKPISAFSGKIASTFWGKSWCDNLDAYADYANRVGRGRSYIRHGCICHLGISEGLIDAYVSGSDLYKVQITIQTLQEERWKRICDTCAGQIGSLVELLQGKFSKEVMRIVCEPETGLFPKPSEISFTCSCPDWASMCKHVAAVLYGIGRRLDSDPALLFTLRGVDAKELFISDFQVEEESQTTLDGADIGALFGIDLEVNESQTQKQLSENAFSKQTDLPNPSSDTPGIIVDSEHPTGESVRRLREFAKLSEEDFANSLDVRVETVRKWESCTGFVKIRSDKLQSLLQFQDRVCGAKKTRKK